MKKIILFLIVLSTICAQPQQLFAISISDITQNSSYQTIKNETKPTQQIAQKAYNEFSQAYDDAKSTVRNSIESEINSNSYFQQFLYYLKIGFNAILKLIKDGYYFFFG